MDHEINPDTLLTDVELAKRAQRSARTIRLWRQRGIGPKFVRLGERGIRYKWSDWQDYVSARTVDPAA
jgi:hypothetical protein